MTNQAGKECECCGKITGQDTAGEILCDECLDQREGLEADEQFPDFGFVE